MVQRITVKAQQCQGQKLSLEKDQSHYLTTVLRLRAGDTFIAQDGTGQQWLAALAQQPLVATIVEHLQPSEPLTASLKLIAALPKGNSFDQVVRQTTELGVTHIYPVLSDRTLLKPSEKKLARWKRIAQEASEQSERLTVPKISVPMPFKVCLEQLSGEGDSEESQPELSQPNSQLNAQSNSQSNELRYLCVARGEVPHLLTRLMGQRTEKLAPVNSLSITLAIGPEGGLTNGAPHLGQHTDNAVHLT
ncbi:MAG: RsmE family RNA methyltransferase, partial [Cyanobacteria bacterium J06598_3]